MLELRVPGDKSITHRALILAALAEGRSRIRGGLTGADCQSTASVLRELGCTIPPLNDDATLEIDGLGLHGLRAPTGELDCGNSGTTARLLMGVVAGAGIKATFTGDASLRSRPMRRVTEPLKQMGAGAVELGEQGRLPIRVEGAPLRGIEFISPHASAQVKSALLLAGLLAGVRVTVSEPLRSRDHTERMLRASGVNVKESNPADQHVVFMQPSASLQPLDLDVPGDFSSAAFILAAALIGVFPAVRVLNVGINPTRTGLLEVWREMNADITLEKQREQSGEPVADLVARPSRLRGVHVPSELLPRMIDEVPVLAATAVRAEGETEIHGASELRIKESDRILALVDNLDALGVHARELDDGLLVEGSKTSLQGQVKTRLDHRIAMAFGVLAAQSGNDITIDDPDVVAVSYPQFWEVLGVEGGS